MLDKIKRALFEVEEEEEVTPKEGDMNMDELERLLKETPSPSKSQVAKPAPVVHTPPAPKPVAANVAPPAPVVHTPPPKCSLDYSIEEVYLRANLPTGKNTAVAMLTMVDQLSGEGYNSSDLVKMVRTMDRIDDEWDEPTALSDARMRIAALSQFLRHIDQDVLTRTGQIQSKYAGMQNDIQRNISNLDGQIEELQSRKSEMLQRLTESQSRSHEEVAGLEHKALSLRESVSNVRAGFERLLSLFSV